MDELDGDGHVDLVADTSEGKDDVVLGQVALQDVNVALARAAELELARGGARGTSESDVGPKIIWFEQLFWSWEQRGPRGAAMTWAAWKECSLGSSRPARQPRHCSQKLSNLVPINIGRVVADVLEALGGLRLFTTNPNQIGH